MDCYFHMDQDTSFRLSIPVREMVRDIPTKQNAVHFMGGVSLSYVNF